MNFSRSVLDMRDVFVPGGPARDAEPLVEHRAVYPFEDAVGLWRTDLGRAVLVSLHRGEQFVGVLGTGCRRTHARCR